MDRMLVATANPGKAREMVEILRDLPLTVSGLDQFPDIQTCEETGASFSENARQKAFYYHEFTGLPTLADDSGLEVEALDAAPGIYSARYAPQPEPEDQDRRRFLLQNLEGKPCPWKAAFQCVVALCGPEG